MNNKALGIVPYLTREEADLLIEEAKKGRKEGCPPNTGLIPDGLKDLGGSVPDTIQDKAV